MKKESRELEFLSTSSIGSLLSFKTRLDRLHSNKPGELAQNPWHNRWLSMSCRQGGPLGKILTKIIPW